MGLLTDIVRNRIAQHDTTERERRQELAKGYFGMISAGVQAGTLTPTQFEDAMERIGKLYGDKESKKTLERYGGIVGNMLSAPGAQPGATQASESPTGEPGALPQGPPASPTGEPVPGAPSEAARQILPPPPGIAPPAAGLLEPGNIDLAGQPIVQNPDGTTSTVKSMSFEENGKEILIPMVAHDGSRVLSEPEAIDQYHKSGKHLGVFRDPNTATAYADQLHKDYESGRIRMRGGPQGPALPPPSGVGTLVPDWAKAQEREMTGLRESERIKADVGLETLGDPRALAAQERAHKFRVEEIKAGRVASGMAAANFKLKDGTTVPGWLDRQSGTYYDSLRRPISGDLMVEVNPTKSVAEENQDLAFKAYADSVGKGVEDLSAEDKLAAIQKFKEDTTPEDIKAARELSQDAARQRLLDADEKKENVRIIAQGIINGHQPPDLTRLYGMGGPVRAELERRGYDLKTATQDWLATQAWIRGMNSTQQIRLQQATLFSRESLDLVDQLAGDLRGKIPLSKVTILNKASMAAAKNGAFGSEAQQIASNLDIQIRDLQSELAQVYKGGNSPTDQGLQQAMGILNSEWDLGRLKAAVELTRKNLTIRLNSIQQTQIMGASTTQLLPPPGAPGAGAGGPQVGTVEGGYRFKGGDPSQQSNWEKVR